MPSDFAMAPNKTASSLLNKACFTDSTVEFPREVAYFCTQEGVVQQSARVQQKQIESDHLELGRGAEPVDEPLAGFGQMDG